MDDKFYLNLKTADNLGIGVFKYLVRPQERFGIVNLSLAKMLGYPSKGELKKISLDKLFINSEEKEIFFKTLGRKGRVKFFEANFKRRDGKPIWIAITVFLVKKTGHLKYFEGIIEDISVHKEMEEKIALEKDFLQGLLDNMPDAIYFKDCNNRIIKVNKFYIQGMGRKPEEIIGKTDFDFFPYEQARRMFEDDNYVLRTGKHIVGKIERNLLPDGTVDQVITTKIPMYDRNGKIIGTMGITRDMTAYANSEQQRFKMVMSSLDILGKALEMRDPYTYRHNKNVAMIAERIAKALEWDENKLLGIRLAGELHDLGKMGIPLDILNKPGKLSELEYQMIKNHVENCCNLIKDIDTPFSLNEIIYQHHERLDGSGYPRGLKRDDIIAEARILAVSDVLESMTSRRPYRDALGMPKALDELRGGSDIKYDSKIVNIVVNLINENKGEAFWFPS